MVIALLCAASGAYAEPAEPLAVLAQPELAGRFYALSDGAVRVGATGPVISEWLAAPDTLERPADPPPVQLGWLEPGVRVVKGVCSADDWEVTTLSGAGDHGAIGDESLWLFRTVRVANRGKQKRAVRLCIGLAGGKAEQAAMKDDVALLEDDAVRLLVSRKPDEVRALPERRETTLAFDFTLPPKGTGEVLVAAPAIPASYASADVPDVRNLDPESQLARIAEYWRDQVLPDTLSLGSRLVTEAYHAAVGSLLIEGPGTDNPAAWAPVIAALARARHGPSISRRVEALLAGQQEDGRFAGAEDNGLQADLTAALADYALYSDDPDRWTRILWRPIARSAGLLESTDVGGPSARRVAPALERAAEVASEVGETARAEELRSRVQALSGAEPAAVPIAAPSDASMSELLTAAHAAVLTGTPEDKQRAWQAVQARLASQPLPGVLMSGDSEDAIAAAQLVALIADSVLRSEGDAVHLFPALPAGWVEEGTIARLDSFPSGLGPVKLEAAVEQDGSVSVSIPKAAKLAKRLRVSPPLGTAAGRLRANGKPAPPGVFEAGPPWTLDGEIWSLVLERPPSSGRP